ncbi:hypothetical protein ACMFMG_008864 [Clarireedia jacksonii]
MFCFDMFIFWHSHGIPSYDTQTHAHQKSSSAGNICPVRRTPTASLKKFGWFFFTHVPNNGLQKMASTPSLQASFLQYTRYFMRTHSPLLQEPTYSHGGDDGAVI